MERKIRVEIELSPERVRKLIETGAKGGKRITDEELKALANVGVIRASDYLDEKQMSAVSIAIPNWIKKAGEKAVVSASSRAAEEIILELVVAERSTEIDDKPKE